MNGELLSGSARFVFANISEYCMVKIDPEWTFSSRSHRLSLVLYSGPLC
jgi:hypothetical protein